MLPKRAGRDDESGVYEDGVDDTPVVAEVLRAATAKPVAAKSSDEGMSLFWRVFGGTILSIAALVVITLFNNLMSTISELRAEINKLNENRAELVRKDEFNTRMNSAWERVQGLQTQNNSQNAILTSQRAELDGLKDRLTRHSTDTDGLRKDTVAAMDAVKKDLAAIDLLKERLTAVEATKKDLAAIEGLKERMNALAADLKTQREDAQKMRQDVEKGLTAEAERKARRDEQSREFERALKELQASITDCQVKLARIEGPAPKPASKSAEKAGPPTTEK